MEPDEIIELNVCPKCGSHHFVVDWNVQYSCDICLNYFPENIVKYQTVESSNKKILEAIKHMKVFIRMDKDLYNKVTLPEVDEMFEEFKRVLKIVK